MNTTAEIMQLGDSWAKAECAGDVDTLAAQEVVTSVTAPEISGALARAHRQVLEALVEGDRVTLEKLVADGCQVIGPKGFVIGKDEWIDTHSAGMYVQILLEVEDSQVTTYDGLVVRCDLQRSECLFNGETIAGLFRVLNVWRRNSMGWQLVAIQYTSVSAEAAPERDR